MHRLVIVFLLGIILPFSFAIGLDCPLFNSRSCRADCTTIPTDIVCERVLNEELQILLNHYGNVTTTPLRLTIKKSPQLQLNHLMFAPVVPHLWDLRIESDTIVNEIPSGSFAGLKNLRFLDLSGNKIAHLHADDFAGLNSMRGLKLERNPIIEIAAGVFDELQSLLCLDLDDNALTCDCKLLWLKRWSMEHPKFWEDDTELYSYSGREDCDGDIPDCEYPPMMRDRNVSEIPADVCGDFLTDIDCIELQSDHCKFYCDNWTPMQIQCTNVGYQEMREVLQRYAKISDRILRLDVSKSPFLTLNTTLWEPVKDLLIHLRLDHTPLTLRPGAFANLHKLIFLELDDNEVAMIPRGTFDGLVALKGLTFDDTDVDHIDEFAFEPLKNLLCLELDDHDEGLCDCDMKWLTAWTHNHSQVFDDKVLMYNYGVKVFCDGEAVSCIGKSRMALLDDC